MPAVTLVFYQEADGDVPVRDWLAELRQSNPKAFAKCVVRLRRLASLGHELRRPEADYLRDGIYELRMREGRVQYRILYAFAGRELAVLSNSLTKEDIVPNGSIELAISRMNRFRRNPGRHSYFEDPLDG